MVKILFSPSKVSAVFFALTFVFSGTEAKAATDRRYDLVYERALYAIAQGDRDLATQLLKEVVQLNPDSAGAWFDLALIYCDSGRSELAEETFALLERRFQLPVLIQQTVNDRRRSGCGAASRFDYQMTYQVAAGTASNANIAPSSPLVQIGSGTGALILELSEKFRPRTDNFLDLGFQIQGPRSDEKNKLLLLMSTRRHTELTDYDFTNVLGVYSRTTSFNAKGEPAIVLTAMASQSTLARQPFDQTGRLAVDGWIKFGQSTFDNQTPSRLGFGLLATANHYDKDPEYNALRVEALFRQEAALSKYWTMQSQIGPIADQALNQRPGGDRRGWSGALEFQWNQHFSRLSMGFSGQATKDAAPYSAVFFPGVTRQTRRLIATARYEVNSQTLNIGIAGSRLFIQTTADDLSDSISIFSYKNHILTLGFIKIW